MALPENDSEQAFANFLPAFFVLLVGAIFGGSMIFVTPPFDVPEELQHFFRSYQISQGTVWAARNGETCGDDMPLSLPRVCYLTTGAPADEYGLQVSVASIKKALAAPLVPGERHFFRFPVTARYSPVCYLPSAAAIAIGRAAGRTALEELYIGRAATLVAYLLLATAAVWLVPVQKWTMALAALMPTSMFLAASLSADAMSIAISLLAISMILRVALRPGLAGRGSLCGLATALAALALVKPGYVLIAFLFLAVPAERFSSRAACWRARALMIGMPLALAAAWLWSIRDLNVPLRPGIDIQAQAHWMLDHPAAYLKLLARRLTSFELYWCAVGVLGWGSIYLRPNVYAIYWGALLATAVLDGGPLRQALPRSLRLGSGAVYILTMGTIATLTYLAWQIVASCQLDGFQSRYLAPVFPLLLLPLRGSDRVAAGRFSRWLVPAVAVAAVLIGVGGTWKTMIARFYWH